MEGNIFNLSKGRGHGILSAFFGRPPLLMESFDFTARERGLWMSGRKFRESQAALEIQMELGRRS